MKPLVEVNSLRMRIDQQLAGPTSPVSAVASGAGCAGIRLHMHA